MRDCVYAFWDLGRKTNSGLHAIDTIVCELTVVSSSRNMKIKVVSMNGRFFFPSENLNDLFVKQAQT